MKKNLLKKHDEQPAKKPCQSNTGTSQDSSFEYKPMTLDQETLGKIVIVQRAMLSKLLGTDGLFGRTQTETVVKTDDRSYEYDF